MWLPLLGSGTFARHYSSMAFTSPHCSIYAFVSLFKVFDEVFFKAAVHLPKESL